MILHSIHNYDFFNDFDTKRLEEILDKISPLKGKKTSDKHKAIFSELMLAHRESPERFFKFIDQFALSWENLEELRGILHLINIFNYCNYDDKQRLEGILNEISNALENKQFTRKKSAIADIKFFTEYKDLFKELLVSYKTGELCNKPGIANLTQSEMDDLRLILSSMNHFKNYEAFGKERLEEIFDKIVEVRDFTSVDGIAQEASAKEVKFFDLNQNYFKI